MQIHAKKPSVTVLRITEHGALIWDRLWDFFLPIPNQFKNLKLVVCESPFSEIEACIFCFVLNKL